MAKGLKVTIVITKDAKQFVLDSVKAGVDTNVAIKWLDTKLSLLKIVIDAPGECYGVY